MAFAFSRVDDTTSGEVQVVYNVTSLAADTSGILTHNLQWQPEYVVMCPTGTNAANFYANAPIYTINLDGTITFTKTATSDCDFSVVLSRTPVGVKG